MSLSQLYYLFKEKKDCLREKQIILIHNSPSPSYEDSCVEVAL